MTARQLVQSDLKVMSVDQIAAAHRAGQFARLLGASEEEVALLEAATGQLSPDQVVALAKAGRHDLVKQGPQRRPYQFLPTNQEGLGHAYNRTEPS